MKYHHHYLVDWSTLQHYNSQAPTHRLAFASYCDEFGDNFTLIKIQSVLDQIYRTSAALIFWGLELERVWRMRTEECDEWTRVGQ